MQEQNQVQKANESLAIKHVMGYNTDFRNNIFLHPKDQQIIYPAANLIVVNNENKQQQFHHCLPGTNGITAMTQSKDKRYLAWAEECYTPLIVVLDLKSESGKKRVFSTKDCKSSSFISINFCNPQEGDGKVKYMVALSAEPEYMLFHFAIDKPRCLGSVNIVKQSLENHKFTHCFYHPKEDDFIVVLGTGQIKTYKLSQDQQPRSLSSQPIKKDNKDLQHSPNYQAYCILQDGTMVIGTDMGELLIFNQNCEIKLILPESPRIEQFNITSIIPYSKGFLVGGSDCTVLIYEKIEGEHKRPYTRIDKKIQSKDHRFPVSSLLLADDKESNLIIGLDNNQMLYVPFNSERVISEYNLKFENQILPFHSAEITGLDVCVRKAQVATCSLDKTVRVWNYQEHTLDNYSEFDEEAYAIAFHPSGFHIIVAFRAKIKILNLFEHEIVPFREIATQNCQEIVFTEGGNLFAINNQSMVQIYNFYTGDLANNISNCILRGTGKVKTIFFEDDDMTIYTGNSDGTVKFWRLDEQGSSAKDIFTSPGFDVTSVCSVAEMKQSSNEYVRTVYISGINKSIENDQKCIYEVKISLKLDTSEDLKKKNIVSYQITDPIQIITEADIQKIALLNSGKLFFFGTSEAGKPGAVRASPYYFDKSKSVQEIQGHKLGITRLKASFDDNYLFTTSKDRSLIIYEIKDKDAKVRLDKEGIGMQFSEEFLMSQEKYNEEQRQIETLIAQRTEKEFKQKQMQLELQKKTASQIAELRRKKNDSDQSERTKIEYLEHEKSDIEYDNEEKKKKLKEQHEYQKRMIDNDYKKKIAMEMTRNDELQKEVEREKIRYENEEKEIKDKHKRDTEEKNIQFESRRHEYETQCKQLHEQQKQMDREHELKLQNLESTAEEAIEFRKEKNEEKMKQLFADLDTNDMQKKTKQSSYEQEASKLEEERAKLKEILEQINTLTEQNKSSQKIKEGQIKEIQERQKTINDKQRRIHELKKKTQELEKFKFVLDYKIKELKRDIGPKEEEIAKMKEQIANMRSEIVHFRRNNATLSLIVTDLRLRQKGMRKEIETLTESEKTNGQYMNNYKQDVNECHSEIFDYKKLKQQCLKLYNKYVQEDNKKRYSGGDKQKDFIKERAHLETSVNGLKAKFTKNLIVHEQDNKRIMDQNVDLIREINDLKRERKNLIDEKQREQTVKKNQTGNQEYQKVEQEIQNLAQERGELQQELEALIQQNVFLKGQIDERQMNSQDQQQYINQEQQQQQQQLSEEQIQQINQEQQQQLEEEQQYQQQQQENYNNDNGDNNNNEQENFDQEQQQLSEEQIQQLQEQQQQQQQDDNEENQNQEEQEEQQQQEQEQEQPEQQE